MKTKLKTIENFKSGPGFCAVVDCEIKQWREFVDLCNSIERADFNLTDSYVSGKKQAEIRTNGIYFGPYDLAVVMGLLEYAK